MHMKWLKGDGVTLSWFQVKEGEDYRWIRTDHHNQMRFIQERLAEECGRQHLNTDAYHMHEYESTASGIGWPYVWDQVWGWRDTPLTYDQMRQRCPQQPFPICCGPNVKPAEDAPEEDELERLHSIRHQTNASDSDEQPAAAGPVRHVVHAPPMAATAEATAVLSAVIAGST